MKAQKSLFADPAEDNGRRVQGGEPSSDVLVSAHVGGNAEVFSKILELHVAKGAKIADITWGTRCVLEERSHR